jgi:hypothetical protein
MDLQRSSAITGASASVVQISALCSAGTPKDCAAMQNITDCDCTGNVTGMQNPLCQSGATYGTVQYRAKSYPGTRHLQVLKGLGNQGIVTSICPANLVAPNAADYGYRPTVAAIVDRIRNVLVH